MITQQDAPQCPIKGHDHRLTFVREHTQDGTGKKATMWECPSGRYRWFHIHDLGFNPKLKMTLPRSGKWKVTP